MSAGAADDQAPLRVVLAKLGLDGHDRGIKVVARILRDAGMEVIYLGLRQTTDSIVAAAEQEDADAIGLSMHNAGHMTLGPNMVKALTDAELDIPVIIGGIVPDEDIEPLKEAGVVQVIDDSSGEILYTVRAKAGFAPPVYGSGKHTVKFGKDKPSGVLHKSLPPTH